MRILQLSYRFPYPPKDGGAIGIFNIAKGLASCGHELTVICANTPKHYFNPQDLPPEVKEMAEWEVVDVDTRITLGGALRNLLSGKAYHCSRFETDSFKNRLEEILTEKDFDIIQFEGPFMQAYLPLVRRLSKAKVTMRMHNVEHIIWDRQSEQEKNPLKSCYLRLQAGRLKKEELKMMNAVDGLFPITEVDAHFLKENKVNTPAVIVPASIDFSSFASAPYTGKWPNFCFLGGLDWMPNLHGVKWFLKEVWPAFFNKFPKAEFHLAGRNAPSELSSDLPEGVTFHGEVDSAKDFLQNHGIVIVPLFSGSGMRIKIIESLAMEKPLISTSIGAEGLGIEPGEDFLLADDAKEMLKAMEKMATNQSYAVDLGRRGRDKVRELYDLPVNAQKMSDFYAQIMRS